ncbi:MAG: hypothetical protein KDD41_09225 [Flavobacteriales bacterium]|nr:hypothetical protein [Flavobacteriales bacterium]
MSAKKEIKISFKVFKIDTVAFSYEEPEDIKPILDNKELGVHLELVMNVKDDENNKGHQLISVIVSSEFYDKESKSTYIKHKGKTVFLVKGLEKTDKKSNQYKLPVDLIYTTYSVSFSHARALLANETSNTVFKNYFLPLIDPAVFVKDAEITTNK